MNKNLIFLFCDVCGTLQFFKVIICYNSSKKKFTFVSSLYLY